MFCLLRPKRPRQRSEQVLWVILFVASAFLVIVLALSGSETDQQKNLIGLFGFILLFSSLSGLILNWGKTIPLGVLGLFFYGTCMAPVGHPDFSPIVGFVLGALAGVMLDLSPLYNKQSKCQSVADDMDSHST